MITSTFKKDYFEIFFPILFSMISISLYNIIDTFFISSINKEALAAFGLFSSVGFFTTILFAMTTKSIITFVSKTFGLGFQKRLRDKIFVGQFVVLFFSLIFFLFFVFGNNLFNIAFDMEDSIKNYFFQFYFIWVFIIFFEGSNSLLSGYLNSLKFAKYSTFFLFICLLFNISLDYILIFGNFGFPKLGIEGAAYATLISMILQTIFLYIFLFKKGYLKTCFNLLKLKLYSKRMIKFSFPLIVQGFSLPFSIFVCTIIISNFETNFIASFGLVFKLEILPIVFTLASSATLGVLYPRYIHSKNFEDAKALLPFSILLSFLYTFLFFFCVILFGDYFGSFFFEENDTIFIFHLCWIILTIPFLFTSFIGNINSLFTSNFQANISLYIALFRTVLSFILLPFIAYYIFNDFWFICGSIVLGHILSFVFSFYLLKTKFKNIY